MLLISSKNESIDTGINIIDFDGRIETTDGKVSVDFIKFDIDDAHTISTMNKKRLFLEVREL